MQKNDQSNSTRKPETPSPDQLVKDGKNAGIELTEQDLDKISGGPTMTEHKQG